MTGVRWNLNFTQKSIIFTVGSVHSTERSKVNALLKPIWWILCIVSQYSPSLNTILSKSVTDRCYKCVSQYGLNLMIKNLYRSPIDYGAEHILIFTNWKFKFAKALNGTLRPSPQSQFQSFLNLFRITTKHKHKNPHPKCPILPYTGTTGTVCTMGTIGWMTGTTLGTTTGTIGSAITGTP